VIGGNVQFSATGVGDRGGGAKIQEKIFLGQLLRKIRVFWGQ